MAIYEFRCPGCGPFELERPMAGSGDPAACVHCGAPARRVYLPPRLARLPAPLRRVRDAEERSAHEPDVAAAPAGRPLPHSHGTAMPWTLSH